MKRKKKINKKKKNRTNQPPLRRRERRESVYIYISSYFNRNQKFQLTEINGNWCQSRRGELRKEKKRGGKKHTSAITQKVDNEYFTFLLYTNVRHRRCFSDDSHTRAIATTGKHIHLRRRRHHHHHHVLHVPQLAILFYRGIESTPAPTGISAAKHPSARAADARDRRSQPASREKSQF